MHRSWSGSFLARISCILKIFLDDFGRFSWWRHLTMTILAPPSILRWRHPKIKNVPLNRHHHHHPIRWWWWWRWRRPQVCFEPTIVGFEPATQNIQILQYNRYQNSNQIFEFFAENWTRFRVNKIQNQGLHGGRFKPESRFYRCRLWTDHCRLWTGHPKYPDSII